MKCILPVLAFLLVSTCRLEAADLSSAISQLRSVSDSSQSKATQKAWRQLAGAEIDQLTTILGGMNDTSPLAENWLRSACDAVIESHLEAGGTMPVDELRTFVLDTSQSPRARQAAYDWLVQSAPTTPEELLPKMLNDPSLDLRYAAVEHLLKQISSKKESNEKIKLLQQALEASRDHDQINGIVKQLKELEQAVDLTEHFGYITTWNIVGPFDIAGGDGFEKAYPPEEKIDLSAKYSGPNGELTWSNVKSDGERGEVDFIDDFGKTATGVMYAVASFDSPEERSAEIRYESSNGTKLWLNDELVATNEVYHSGSPADQYVVPVKLQKGKNTIVLKICQTERREDWAHVWSFRLRVSDSLGGAIRQASR